MLSNSLSWKSSILWDNVEKHGIAVQATDDSSVHALRMLDNLGFRQTLGI